MSIEEIKEWWNKLPSYDKLTFEESVVLTDTVDFLLAEIDRLTARLTHSQETKQTLAEECERLAELLHTKTNGIDELNIEQSKIGSCQCLTKTPETQYHSANCPYRVICELQTQLKASEAKCERLQEDRDLAVNVWCKKLKEQLVAAEARAATHLADQDLLVARERKRVVRQCLNIVHAHAMDCGCCKRAADDIGTTFEVEE